MSKTIVVVRNLYPLNIGMNDCTTFGLSPVHTGSKVCIQAHQKLMDLCSGCKLQLVPKFEKCWVFSLYLRRSSCFIRLCFSLCSPSVTRYISLKQDRRNLLLNSYSMASVCTLQGNTANTNNAYTHISFSRCSREACSCSIASCSWASTSSWLVLSSALDNSLLVIFSLTFSTWLSCFSLLSSEHWCSN